MSSRSPLVWVKHSYGGEKALYNGGVIFRRRSAYYVLCEMKTSVYKDAKDLKDAKLIIDTYLKEQKTVKRKEIELEIKAISKNNPPLAWLYTSDRKGVFAEYKSGFIMQRNGKYSYSVGGNPYRAAAGLDEAKRKIDSYNRKANKR